jgi:Fe-S cluster assembly protein SufD
VFKKLFSYEILEADNDKEVYYKLEDLYDYITSESYISQTSSHVDKNVPKHVISHYLDNLYFLREHGLPHYKQEQFNTFNLSKLYSIDILQSSTRSNILSVLDKYDYLASSDKNHLLLVDGQILSSSTLQSNIKYGVQVLEYMSFSKHRQAEYIKLIENTDNFSNFTYATTMFPNVVVFPHGSKDRYTKNPVHVNYENSVDDPVLESNTTIFDVQYDTHVKLIETVKTFAGQNNYTTYIVRENSTLEIDRHSLDFGGWNIFDSRFICHPNSTVKINFTNTGSTYTQENFYFKCSSNVNVELVGRNNIYKGNEYYQFVKLKSSDHNNTSKIDIKNVGSDHSKTSFIGNFYVNPASEGFVGSMTNQNLMLYNSAQMQSRPILDIYTKEIECTHGCTISNVDENQLYYLQSRGFDTALSRDILVDSFLC